MPPQLHLDLQGVAHHYHTLRAAPPDGTIFSFQMSPSNDYVLLYFGDAKYTIASADTLEDLLTLPSTPPAHDDATGISLWLLDDDYLLGEAELPPMDTVGKTAAEVEALLPRKTLFYIYGLESRTLTPVEIDATLPPIFSIHDVSGWDITLYDSELLGATVVPGSKCLPGLATSNGNIPEMETQACSLQQ